MHGFWCVHAWVLVIVCTGVGVLIHGCWSVHALVSGCACMDVGVCIYGCWCVHAWVLVSPTVLSFVAYLTNHISAVSQSILKN